MTDGVCVLTFSSVAAGAGFAGREALVIAEALARRGRLTKLFCSGFDRTALELTGGRVASPAGVRVLADRALGRLGRYARFPERRLRESLLDGAFEDAVARDGAATYLFMKPAFLRTSRRLKASGRRLVALATTLHPRFNLEAVEEEERRTALRVRSAYTDRRRVRRLSDFYATMDEILVPSRLAQASFAQFGESPPQLRFIGNEMVVDIAKFAPGEQRAREDSFLVLHLSQMTLIKGIGFLLEAWKRLDLPQARLVLAGSMDANVATLVRRAGLKNVEVLGHVVNPAPLFRMADVFVSPSISDSMPGTVFEAMASGVAPIVSDRCGAAESVRHGENGFVYPFDAPDKLAQHIAWCHAHREHVRGLGTRARQSIVERPASRFADTVIDVLEGATPAVADTA
ncbi:MAG TPA: glycosyltransferase family 4 protein [Rhizomicrobium sp.]|jgi:glycosyltransferase involved in cell wall biosynthesis